MTYRHPWIPMATLSVALLAPCTAALAQTETLQTKQSISLRDQPTANGTALATLPAGTTVTRTAQRSGAWTQVQTSTGQTGWVHMFELTASTTNAPSNNALTGALRGLSGFLNRGSSTSGTTVATSTVGIRGLSKEDIQNATPNAAAVEQLERLRADEAQARRHGSERQLLAQAVPPLPAPANTTATAPSSPVREGK